MLNAKRNRRTSDICLLAKGHVLGQDQGANLDHFVCGKHRAHGVSVVEVAVAERVHADLGPGRIVKRGVGAGLSVRLADR